MKKAGIRVIKRHEEAVAEKIGAPGNEESGNKPERRMTDAVKGWISQYYENKRAEKISASRQIRAWKNNVVIVR